MNRYIILYDKDGKEIGRQVAVCTYPQKNGDQFANEAAYYYYKLDSVERIEIIYRYENNPE